MVERYLEQQSAEMESWRSVSTDLKRMIFIEICISTKVYRAFYLPKSEEINAFPRFMVTSSRKVLKYVITCNFYGVFSVSGQHAGL